MNPLQFIYLRLRSTLLAAAALAGFLCPATTAAQTRDGAVEGIVVAADGAPIGTATVEATGVPIPTPRLVDTDPSGHFRIDRLPPGRYRIRVQRIGFREVARSVEVQEGETVSVELVMELDAIPVAPLSVDAERARIHFESEAGSTVRRLEREELRRIPGLAEADVLRAVESLPGVVSTSDYSAAFNVRGGSADQNLILLDGLPVYNPFHLGGLFGVFNTDMVRRADLMAGGFPAEYGGRVSSVLSVESDAGPDEFRAQGGVSLLAARLALGGPLPTAVTEGLGLRSARARISARRSYFDFLLEPVVEFPYHLTDVQGYIEAETRSGGRFTVTAYTGADVLDLTRLHSEDVPLRVRWNWGNDLVGLGWRRPIAGGEVRVRAGFSRFDTAIRFPDFDDTRFGSSIAQGLLRLDLDLPATRVFALQTGVEAGRTGYDNLAESGGTTFVGGHDAGWFGGAYLQGRWRPSEGWLVELGARGDGWSPDAPGAGAVLVIAPRFALKRFLADGDAALKLAAGRYTQFLHSLRDEELPIGIDIWVTTGHQAPHLLSDQVQVGFERFFDGGWSVSLEGYYRLFDGVTAANPADDPNRPDDDMIRGEGRSYGADFLLRRDAADGVTGWVTVSWLRAVRTFPDALAAVDPAPTITYPPVFDRRIDVDVVLRVPLPGSLEGGLRWNYGSGLPYTRPVTSYAILAHSPLRGKIIPDDDGKEDLGIHLGPRNSERYPAYHRLDLSLRRKFTPRWGSITPYLNVLNVYNRKNVLFYFYDYERTPPIRSGVTMFPILPTLGVEVAF
jgi:hypothetical protein